MSSAHSPVNILQIGYGYWGTNLARCFEKAKVNLTVVDMKFNGLEKGRFQSIDQLTDSFLSQVDGVVIATPPSTHKQMALWAQGATSAKILIEKPMVLSVSEADALRPFADRIMVDHTFLYAPEYEYIHDHMFVGDYGKPLYAYAERLNLGKFQECGVVWDLAPHDIAVFSWLFGRLGTVDSCKISKVRYEHGDAARLELRYNGTDVHLHLSWIHPVKVRRTTIVCENAMVVYDMMAEEKVKVYRPGADMIKQSRQPTESYGDYLMRYRTGDIYSPYIAQKEPLQAVVNEFLNFCLGKAAPKSNFTIGWNVVSVLEQTNSIAVVSKKE